MILSADWAEKLQIKNETSTTDAAHIGAVNTDIHPISTIDTIQVDASQNFGAQVTNPDTLIPDDINTDENCDGGDTNLKLLKLI